MSAHRRAPEPKSDFDERIISLIQAAYADEPLYPFDLGLLAYEMFCTAQPPQPLIPNLRPDLFLSFAQARQLESIVLRALSCDREDEFPTSRAFGDALSQAFGPYLVEAPVAVSEELILLGRFSADLPLPSVLAIDGIHAIDLLIEDPNRRLLLRDGLEATHLLDALRDCVLRRAPIVVDHESARFPSPALVPHRPITDRDVELLRCLI